MPNPQTSEITGLLKAWSGGDDRALERLTPLVYRELRRLAHRYMRKERSGNTLQTTALVHEAYLRLADGNALTWNDRIHFFAVSAQTMRRILVDRARARAAAKRGGSPLKISLNEVPDFASRANADLVAIDEALTSLAVLDPRKSKVVEMRYFGGLTVEETALALGISPQSVMRDWKLAKAWLLRELQGAGNARQAPADKGR